MNQSENSEKNYSLEASDRKPTLEVPTMVAFAKKEKMEIKSQSPSQPIRTMISRIPSSRFMKLRSRKENKKKKESKIKV